MTRYALTPQARSDLIEIADYILRNDGADRAAMVVPKIVAAIERIAEQPGIGHVRDDLTDQDVLFKRVYRYLIVYRRRSEPLEVVAIVGGYRDVGRWLEGRGGGEG